MKRDIIISVLGHLLAFAGMMVPSFLPSPRMKPMQVVSVTAVTPQSISRLLTQVDRVETPRPKVPQVQVEKEKLIPNPERRTRKVQTVKRAEKPAEKTEPKEPAAKSDSNQKGIELPNGTKTDQAVDFQYLNVLMETIFRNWKYPPGNDPNIKTVVFFELSRDGRLRRIRVEKGSRNMAFDRSAYEAIQKSNPLPPLPDDFVGDKLGVHLAFSY